MTLFDTNIVSYLFKKHPVGDRYVKHLVGASAAISFVTEAELLGWAEHKQWGESKRRELEIVIAQYEVVPHIRELSVEFARIYGERRRAGRPMSTSDIWIAATAIVIDAPLVTHNRKDFTGIAGLTIISENKTE